MVSNMKINLGSKLLILTLCLFLALPLFSIACQEAPMESQAPPTDELSETLVPNIPLDIYLYARQGSPTTIPAEMLNSSQDINIDSLAIWVVPSEDELAFGMALTFTQSHEASTIHNQIKLEERVWKKLSGNIIYLVYGTGSSTEALKTAIANNDFKHYDDEGAIQELAVLPNDDINKPAAVAIAKPTKALIESFCKVSNIRGSNLINAIINLVNFKIIVGGLYSPQYIDIFELVEEMNKGANINDFDLGMLVSIKYGLPDTIVKLVVERFLLQAEFTKEQLGDLTVYKGFRDINNKGKACILIRVEDNHIFAAVSGQESYAENLITSINLKTES